MRRICLLILLAGCGDDASALPDAATAIPDAADNDGAIDARNLGAIPYPGGTTFRVWAPHADAVSVVGDWNNWDATRDPMARDAGGVWSADVAGVGVGAQYRYSLTASGQTLVHIDPYAQRVTNSKGNGVVDDPRGYSWQHNFRAAPANEQVIYELHVGSFNNPAGTIGTFDQVQAKMDYLQQLGITAIEIMPPAEFPGSNSWGYNPALPMAVESTYGGPDALRALVDAAHARGIAVLVDVVYNHWGRSNIGASDLMQGLWCFDVDCLGAGGIYFYTDTRQNTPWGPRPDFGRPEVRQYIVDSAIEWLRDYHADGLRWDSTTNIRQINGVDNADGWLMLEQAMAAVHQLRPDSIQVAEDFANDDRVTTPQSSGGLGFDTQWDGGFFHPVDDNIITTLDSSRSMPAIAGALQHKLSGRATARVVYTEDHDEVANGKQRIPEMISPGDAGSLAARKRSTLGAALVFTAPGIPMIFMGQEFLSSGTFANTPPLDWSRTTTYGGIWQMYRDLIALRRTLPGLKGEHIAVHHVNDTAKVIAYRRWNQGNDDVVVVANFANRAFTNYLVGLPSAGTWHVRFQGDSQIYSADFGGAMAADITATATARDGLPATGAVVLGPWSAVILSQ
jgi:1,4-alpha-glucan branching enzyme